MRHTTETPRPRTPPRRTQGTLGRFRSGLDSAKTIAEIAAIAAAGIWVLTQFDLHGESDTNIQLSLSADVLPYSHDTRLLVIHAKPKNIGKVPVDVEHMTFPVVVRPMPSNQPPGLLTSTASPLVNTDILARYPDGYVLEPGVEYNEVVTAVVPPGTYTVTATLNTDNEDMFDDTLVIQIP